MSNPDLLQRIAAAQTRITTLEAEIRSLQSQPPSAPSTLSIAIAATIAAALGSYFYTQAKSLNLFSTSSNPPKSKSKSKSRTTRGQEKPTSWPNSYDVTVHPDSSDEELMRGLTRGEDGIARSSSASSASASSNASTSESEEEEEEEQPQGDLSTFPSPPTEEHKMTLILRTDLSMTRGKLAAQASHATLANYRYFLSHAPSHPCLKQWERGGQAKVALKVDSEEELLVLQAQAVSLGLCAQVVRDAGRTQVEAGSVTALAVGPGPRGVVDRVTGGLKLL